MRKITILEVLDPIKNEFIPIRQAINQGLFNTQTYLFFNPIENKHYSITEAARLGLFKSAIDLRPEALIVERIKVAQTVQLLSARDTLQKNKLISIQEAIETGIVDTNLRIYRDPLTHEVIELGDAIDSDLIQVKLVREITEKITETLTEQKNPENLGLIKKVETSSSNTNFIQATELDNDNLKDNDEENGVRLINGLYVFDRTKSLSINKMMKKYDDDIAAGYITDSNSIKILNPNSKTLNPMIDFNDAIEKNLIILPDSLCITQNVQYVVDLNTGNKFDFDAACEIGLIDVKKRIFYDTRNRTELSLFEALGKNYIVMRDELNTNYDADNLEDDAYLKKKSINETITHDDLDLIFDPVSGEKITIKKAIDLGLLNKGKTTYIDPINRKTLSLNEAVERGLATLKSEKMQKKKIEGYEFLHIKGVKNPVTNQEMSLNEAISSGFLDHTECEFHDPISGKSLTLLDAYDKGYLITSDSKKKSTSQLPKPKERKSRKEESNDFNKENKPTQKLIPQSESTSKPSPNPQLTLSSNNTNNRIIKSQSISPQRSMSNSNTKNLRSTSSFDVKSLDKLSMMSKKSVIIRLKERMMGKKSKSNRFDDYLILKALRIIDTKTNEKYTLDEAIKMDLVFPEDRLRDTLYETDYSIKEAIQKGVIKFFHPINNFEFKYDQSCSIFNEEYLLLVNYVIHPVTRKKIGLKTAFSNQIIDKYNSIYFKKRPIELIKAIEKGYLSCEIIELNLLGSIIASAVFKHYPNKNETKKSEEKINASNLNKSKSETTKVPKLAEEDSFGIETPKISPQNNLNIKKKSSGALEEDGSISKDLLKQSGVKFNENKKYVISEVYDSEKDKFVPLKKASFIGILNLNRQEYVDSKTGNVMSLPLALNRNKIKIKESTMNELNLDTTVDDLTDVLDSSKFADLDTTISTIADIKKGDLDDLEIQDLKEAENKLFTSTLKNSSNNYEPISIYESKLNDPKMSLTEPLNYDSFTSSLNSKLNGNLSSKSSNIFELPAENGFNLTKTLLYKKPSNGKYIRFERVIKNQLFDSTNGLVKDLNTNEYVTVNQGLLNGLLRINDQNVLFDDSNIYVIDSVLVNSRKFKLSDALDKKVIDKSRCNYKFLNHTFSIKEAMKKGYIEGKIITSNEVKWLLEDYANRVESKLNLSISSKTIRNEQDETKTFLQELYTSVESVKKEIKESIESFNEFFIFDQNSESYISMNDAYYNGIIFNDPVRIKEPFTNNYILLKDAVIKGLISCEKSNEKIGFKNRSSFLTHNRTSYLIDAVLDSKKQVKYSLQDAIKQGIYLNGVYRNFHLGEAYSLNEAIENGYVIGKQVDLDEIESCFKNSLGGRYEISRPPAKPSRGIFLDEIEKNGLKQRGVKSRSKSSEQRKKFNSEETILRSKIEPFSGNIVSVQDIVSGRYVKPYEAEKYGLINFLEGTFKNSLTNEVMKINEAMEKGFILVESSLNRNNNRLRAASDRGKKNFKYDSDDLLNTSRVEIGQQFDITSVLDPIQRKHINLEEAINLGIFDIGSAMYIDPRTKKKSTLVDAIDQSLIKIADKSFKPSFKLVIEENDKNFVKNINTLSIRYVVDSFSQKIIPVNLAVQKKIVNLEKGTYNGSDRIMSFKEAYDKFFAFTVNDLDNVESKRAKFRVGCVRKSTTGKNMSLKSALAKNWISVDRRVYIDKQTNQEISFSQAVDLDLLVLVTTLIDDGAKTNSQFSLMNTIDRSKSNNSFLTSDYSLNSKLSSSKTK